MDKEEKQQPKVYQEGIHLIRREDESTTSSATSSPRTTETKAAKVENDGPTVTFNFKETEPNTSTFASRFFHFINVTWMPNWFVDDSEI